MQGFGDQYINCFEECNGEHEEDSESDEESMEVPISYLNPQEFRVPEEREFFKFEQVLEIYVVSDIIFNLP